MTKKPGIYQSKREMFYALAIGLGVSLALVSVADAQQETDTCLSRWLKRYGEIIDAKNDHRACAKVVNFLSNDVIGQKVVDVPYSEYQPDRGLVSRTAGELSTQCQAHEDAAFRTLANEIGKTNACIDTVAQWMALRAEGVK